MSENTEPIICNNCEYARAKQRAAHLWVCAAPRSPSTVSGQRSPVTGQLAETRPVFCSEQNEHSNCQAFVKIRCDATGLSTPQTKPWQVDDAFDSALEYVVHCKGWDHPIAQCEYKADADRIAKALNREDAGAQVNYTALYMVIACVFGVAIGVAMMGLWG